MLLPLALMTLNLHGYHPMKEGLRYSQDKQGKIYLTTSDIYYFTQAEIDRGHKKRIERLSQDVAQLAPEVVFFQEVGAGDANSKHDCAEFDSSPTNTARKIQARLGELGHAYQLALACRGNTGWVTSASTFKDQRILRKKAGGGYEIVFDFGATPYPKGLIVEGLAALVAPGWQILENQSWWTKYDAAGDSLFTQALALAKDGHVVVAVNIHGNHKVAHFEAAVAIRKRLADFEAQVAQAHAAQGQVTSVLVSGDFNARLYRHSADGSLVKGAEVSTVPWEIAVPGQFDYSPAKYAAWKDGLSAKLLALNADPNYKPGWAIPAADAASRVPAAVASLGSFKGAEPMQELLETAGTQDRCDPSSSVSSACSMPSRIDHVFMVNGGQKLESAMLLYPEDTWTSLAGVSDHPGVLARFDP